MPESQNGSRQPLKALSALREAGQPWESGYIRITGPTVLPPTVAVEATAEGVPATWRNNVKIDALWSIDETRNAWVRVVGVGWRKIYNGRAGAFQALTTLAAQARQTGRPVNLREEPDGMIYEISLW